MKKTKIVWRLKTTPTVEEVNDLLKNEVITKEEAREILFTEETQEDVKTKYLKKEIEFLKENLAYIEDIARKQFGLVKEDELVYQLQPKEGNEFGSDRR